MYLLIFAALLFQLGPPLQLFLTNFEEPVRINNQLLHKYSGGACEKVEHCRYLTQAFWSHLGCSGKKAVFLWLKYLLRSIQRNDENPVIFSGSFKGFHKVHAMSRLDSLESFSNFPSSFIDFFH